MQAQTMDKYLGREDIIKLIGEFVLEDGFSPMSQDSYNETMVGQKIARTKMVPQLCQAAINMSVVGFGNKRYGAYRVGDKTVDLKVLFDSCDIKYRNAAGALLREDDVTPNRLCRFFRYEIRAYIDATGSQSYMFRKYSDHNPKYVSIAFRGAEYLDDLAEDQRQWLRATYMSLDAALATRITDRLDRVFQAKAGLTFSPART